MDYSTSHIASLLKNIEEALVEERADLGIAVRVLSYEDRLFLSYIVRGYAPFEAGRLTGHPNNTTRRFKRICRDLSKALGGCNA